MILNGLLENRIKEAIILHNDELFEKVRFTLSEGRLVRIGEGGSSYAYEGESKNGKEKYIIKVTGLKGGIRRVSDFADTKSKLNNIWDDHIVKIKEVCIYSFKYNEQGIIDSPNQVYYDYAAGDNEIIVAFSMMERLASIIEVKDGVMQFSRGILSQDYTGEILRLANDIGNALKASHEKGLIHRDVKIENIFYDPEKDIYKLGDFDNSALEGEARNRVFTRGYGAPETVYSKGDISGERADIYSFGVVLFLLLNNFKFPGSDSYRKNLSVQYAEGFVFPEPDIHDTGLWQIVSKMCSYSPEDRYSSMDEVLREIEAVRFGKRYCVRKEDRNGILILSIMFAFLGGLLFKESIMPGEVLKFGVIDIVFIVICLIRGIYFFVDDAFNWITTYFGGMVYLIDSFLGGLLALVMIIISIIMKCPWKIPFLLMTLLPTRICDLRSIIIAMLWLGMLISEKSGRYFSSIIPSWSAGIGISFIILSVMAERVFRFVDKESVSENVWLSRKKMDKRIAEMFMDKKRQMSGIILFSVLLVIGILFKPGWIFETHITSLLFKENAISFIASLHLIFAGITGLACLLLFRFRESFLSRR